MCRKSQEISSPHLEPFSVESRKTSRGAIRPPPPPVIGLKGVCLLHLSAENSFSCVKEHLIICFDVAKQNGFETSHCVIFAYFVFTLIGYGR